MAPNKSGRFSTDSKMAEAVIFRTLLEPLINTIFNRCATTLDVTTVTEYKGVTDIW